MEHLSRLFFEDRVLLLLAEVAALAVALAVHRRRMTPRSRRNVWMMLAVCAALLAIQHLVQTDREKIETRITGLVQAVDQGDIAAVAACLDDEGVDLGSGLNFEFYEKETFVQAISLSLQTYQVDEARVGGFEIKINGDQAVVSFRVACDLSNQGGRLGRRPNFWKVHCVRRPEGWRLDQIISGKFGVEGFGPDLDIMAALKNWCSQARHALQP